MNEPELRSILNRLGARTGRTNQRGWIEFPCLLSPWTHERGHDSRPSAAARINPEGPSSFVCKACHAHGRIAKLINLLATYRNDNSIRSMMVEADRADAQAQISAGFGEFDYTYTEEIIEPLVEAQFDGIYEYAADVPDAWDYLLSRRIEAGTANMIGLLWEPTQRRILFPIRGRHGELYGFSGRAIDLDTQPKIRDYYGLPKRHLILGEERWEHGKPLIIVEGLFGWLSMIDKGIDLDANVGAILGSFLTPEKAARIIDFDEPTYLMLDPDAGGDLGLFGSITPEGERETNGAIDLLQGHVPLFVPEWPEGVTDPDQLTREHIQTILANTPLYGVSTLDNEW